MIRDRMPDLRAVSIFFFCFYFFHNYYKCVEKEDFDRRLSSCLPSRTIRSRMNHVYK